MIERLTNTLIAGVDLLESEGRLAKRHAARFLAGAAFFVLSLVVALFGLLALLTGLTYALAVAWTVPGALAVVGFVVAAVGAGATYAAYRRMN